MNIDRKELVDALVEAAEIILHTPEGGEGELDRALRNLKTGREAARVDVRKRFDEQALRDDIVAAFGPAGAHVDLLDMLTAELAEAKRRIIAKSKERDQCRVVVDELAKFQGPRLQYKFLRDIINRAAEIAGGNHNLKS